MLSILIPIYNFEITALVYDLYRQCQDCKIKFEVLCFDDGSASEFKILNQKITQLQHVHYQELPQNLGRSKIRNVLAQAAQYPYLLFLDGDSKVVSDNFIRTYIAQLHPEKLLYGGRVYAPIPPIALPKKLHYYFGKKREEISVEQRKKSPYHSFMTNNFLMPKKLFSTIQFTETIQGYGHEDTLFGLMLQQRAIPIIHLENPLEHLGLEENDVFINKQKTALKNLYLLHQQQTPIQTKLLTTYTFLKKWKLHKLAYAVLSLFSRKMLQQLKKEKPNLLFLDFFKLYYLLKIDHYGIDDLSN